LATEEETHEFAAHWRDLLTFELQDATAEFDKPFTLTKEGVTQHCSHIFAYNWVCRDKAEYMAKVSNRLNLTDFQILAWSANPR
jgi:hypothetical protein